MAKRSSGIVDPTQAALARQGYSFQPIDHDPFALAPVEHDPFPESIPSPTISQLAPPMADNQPGMLSRLFGATVPPVRAEQSQAYPGPQDTAIARSVGQTYGDPVAGYDVPGSVIRKISTSAILQSDDDSRLRSKTPVQATPGDREDILRNWLAAQRSPVSALGFDPHHTVETPAGGPELSVGGVYTAPTKAPFRTGPDVQGPGDVIWYNGNQQDTVVHEAMHRGIELMRQAGVLPDSFQRYVESHPNGEEYAVRAMKVKAFGDIEKGPDETNHTGNEQVEEAKWRMANPHFVDNKGNDGDFNTMLSDLESAAAAFAAKRRPGGPR